LNRNFPDLFKKERNVAQPEALAMEEWLRNNNFVLSACLHGGALVASYPFDNKATNGLDHFRGFQESKTPDDDVFRQLALSYSLNHRTMHRGGACHAGDSRFKDGITNGAAWYYLAGGMQDYNYVQHGCMEVTLEVSCCKYPRASELPQFWEDNKDALLKYMGQAHRGVKGVVRDGAGNPVAGVKVNIAGRDFGTKTSPRGEFWRILLPGTYQLSVESEGYPLYVQSFEVRDGTPTVLDINLQRGGQQLLSAPHLEQDLRPQFNPALAPPLDGPQFLNPFVGLSSSSLGSSGSLPEIVFPDH